MDIIKINDTSNKLYYIGGIVRDFLLNRESLDIDITYAGNAIEYCAQFGDVLQINPDFGTIKVLVDGREVDFASTRTEKYEKKGHLPQVDRLGVSLKEDVLRRDFTINALAMSVSTGEIVDYTGGVEDLNNGILRVLHDKSFIDDPTRIIRGLKFAMRFGFDLDEHTKNLQDEYLANINYDMSYARVKKELIETFGYSGKMARGLQWAYDRFINDGIYRLVTPDEVENPSVNIENLIMDYPVEHQWLVFAGTLRDLSRLPLTRTEQKIVDDVPACGLSGDFEIYKAFEHLRTESILLYGILYDEYTARRYLDVLKHIKITVNGEDLKELGFPPSQEYSKCFDFVLKEKLKNPYITRDDELILVKKYYSE